MIRNQDVDNGRFAFSPRKAILIIFNYFIGYQTIYPLIGLLVFGADGDQIHPKGIMLATIIALVTMLYLASDMLKRSFRYFKNNLSDNFKIILKYSASIFAANIILSLLIQALFGNITAGNQDIIEAGFGQLPVLYGFTAVIFAPIVEEIVFRGVLYQQFRNKKNYVIPMIISSLSFGLIHTLPIFMQSKDPKELIFVIVYTAMGYFMVKAYEESGSIWAAIAVHFVNNFIATMLMILG